MNSDVFDAVAYINEPRWRPSVMGLERIHDLLERMGRPQDKLKFVHVAGTNGKGSTCAYIESILRQAGYRTGLFTSPYLIRFEERIRVNGQVISEDDLRDVTLFVRKHAEAQARDMGQHATEFELMTAVALEHFARCGCDIVVLEVGLGGRLDSTNVIEAPEACVICRIGLDHTALLGNTKPQIAAEKAGIIKPGAQVISYPQDDPETQAVIDRRAHDCKCRERVVDFSELKVAPVDQRGRLFSYRGVAYQTSLLGSYQPFNAAVAIETARALARRGWLIDDVSIQRGIALTQWPGRFEVVRSVSHGPVVIVDGGHNPQGAQVLADSLEDVFPKREITFVMGVLADKDYRSMIAKVLPCANGFFCMTPPNPRALPAEQLACAVREVAAENPAAAFEGPVRAFSAAPADERDQGSAGDGDSNQFAEDAISQALRAARQFAGDTGIVCAFGSLYSIASVKAALS